jgi:hypothetical protein
MNDHVAQGHGMTVDITDVLLPTANIERTDLKVTGFPASDRNNAPEGCASVLVESVTPRTMVDHAHVSNGAAELSHAIDL